MTIGEDLKAKLEANIEATKAGVGDVSSKERGSGARFNSGKPAVELIPVRQLISMWRVPLTNLDYDIIKSLEALADFQEGDDAAIAKAMAHARGYVADAARVLDYGRKKYAEWNWAKGMPWSVCIGCALRHIEAVARFGTDSKDAESGELHMGHYLCNLIFLAHYARHYHEGDDRPPKNCFVTDGVERVTCEVSEHPANPIKDGEHEADEIRGCPGFISPNEAILGED